MLKKFPAFVRVAWVTSAEASFSAARDGRLGHPAAARPVVKGPSRDGLLQSRIAMPKTAQDVHEAAKLVTASRMPVQGPCR